MKVTNLEKRYKNKKIFDNISFSIETNNKKIGIYGESGTGKTTLGKILARLDTKFSGELSLPPKILYVDQNNGLFEELTVIDNLMLFSDDKILIKELSEKLKLEKYSNTKVIELSDGNKKKVTIIRALIQKNDLIIFDEPTATLDYKTSETVIELFNMIDSSILFLTHDEDLLKICNKTFNIEELDSINESEEEITYDITTNKFIFSKYYKIFSSIIKSRIILMTLISFLFVISFSIVTKELYEEVQNFTAGYTENIITINEQEVKELYEGIHSTPDDQFSWTFDNIEAIENIAGVTEVYALSPEKNKLSNVDDEYISTCIPKDELPDTLVENTIILPECIYIESVSVSVPKELAPLYQMGNTIGLEVETGAYPEDYSNEVLIPDWMANGNDVVGEEVTTSCTILNAQKNPNNEQTECTFIISGTYNTDYDKVINESYLVYFGFSNSRYIMEEPELFFTEEMYNNAIASGYDEYFAPAYESYESWVYANGTGETQIIIYCENADDIPYVLEQLTILFPNYYFKSIESINNGTYPTNIHDYYLEYIKIFLIISLIFIIISFLICNIINSRYKSYLYILRQNNVSSKNLRVLIVSDALITTTITFIIITLIIVIGSFIKISFINDIFTYSLNIFYLGSYFIFILLINLSNTLFNMIRSKNARN